MKKEKTPLIRQSGFQTLLSSLVCVLGGLIIGYIVLLLIEPSGALGAITAIMKSFFRYPGKNDAQVFRTDSGAHCAFADVCLVRVVCI